jgi:hypothetical protein
MALRRLLVCVLAAAVAALALGLAACGGSDETTTVTAAATGGSAASAGTTTATETGGGEAAQEEIAPPDAQAKSEIDKLAGEVDADQQQANAAPSDTIAGSGQTTLSYSQAKGSLSQARYCGSIYAGPNTSCAFALNVAYDYFLNGRPRRFQSYSPITGAVYNVYCRGHHPTVCVAGNNASVFIP